MSTASRILLGCLALSLFVGGLAVGVWHREPWEDRVAELEGEARKLRAELALRDERITALEARPEPVPQPALEVAPEVTGTVEAGAGEGDPVEETGVVKVTGTGRRSVEAAAWLRNLLPERFGDVSAEEVRYLRELDLGGLDLTDLDLRHLGGMASLTNLKLAGNDITDAGLSHLQDLDRLTHLDLTATAVEGPGLAYLNSPSLDSLHLSRAQLTDDSLQHLSHLTSLRSLKLNHMDGITDGGLEWLRGHVSLRHVELDNTSVTDEGLANLLYLNPSIERLEVRDTAVTQETAVELVRDYRCNIVLQQGSPGIRFGVEVRD